MKSEHKILKEYADTLSEKELKKIVVALIEQLILTEDVTIDDEGQPYWTHSGDWFI